MLKFVKTSPCRSFNGSKSLDCSEDEVDGGYHSPLEGRRSLSFDNIHTYSDKQRRHFDVDDDNVDTNDALMTNGQYNTMQHDVVNSPNFNTLKMMVSMFRPKPTEGFKGELPFKSDYRESVREGRHSVAFYMNQLCRHLDPQIRMRSPSKKLLKGLVSIENLLTSLEVDLRSNPNATWLREFIDDPNSGHVLLLKFLKYLQDCSSSCFGTHTERGSKGKKSEQILAKEPTDEHLCLMCLKAIVRNKYGFHKVLSAPRSLSTMAFCLRLANIKTKIGVLKILSEACEHPGGFDKTLQAFEDYKQVKQERYRFESVVHSVIFRGRLNNPLYMEMVLHFFNALLSNAPTLNQRVFHQQELEQAGFSADKVEYTLDGLNADGLRDELSRWRNNYIDVSNTLDEYLSLRGRSNMLRDEVDMLQVKLEEFQREKNSALLEKQELERKVAEYKVRASELHLKIENIKRHHTDNNEQSERSSSDITHEIETVVEEILRPSTPIPPPPPPPPPRESSIPPPPAPPSFDYHISGRNYPPFRKSSAKLPMLHWQTIQNPAENSIFANMSPSSLDNRINYEELDQLFQIKQNTLPARDNNIQKLSNAVTVLNTNKARSLLIARKRINLPEYELQHAIDVLDIVTLPPECAELLVKFTPTTEERLAIRQNMNDFTKMADAEQFMVQLMEIERLESKLNTMVFMGSFDELFQNTTPQIEAIISASVSIATSAKLRKILEIVLAVGNYMNGRRRGFTKAFKLESLTKLEEVKSNNKKGSLLQYIVTMVQSRFSELENFYDEIFVQPTLSISMETLASDIRSLRRGIDVSKIEKEHQSTNYVLHNFFHRAVLKVHQVGERYRKMEEQYQDVCALFCENPKTTEPAAFFATFHKFIEAYKNAKKQIETQYKEDIALKKAKMLQTQNQKLKETAALNSKMAVQVVKRRRSEYYDQNQNILNTNRADGGDDEIPFDRLSMSCPRALSYENLLYTNTQKTPSELEQSTLFQRTKRVSESDARNVNEEQYRPRERSVNMSAKDRPRPFKETNGLPETNLLSQTSTL